MSETKTKKKNAKNAAVMEDLVEKGKESGSVTPDEVIAAAGDTQPASKGIEEILDKLEASSIRIAQETAEPPVEEILEEEEVTEEELDVYKRQIPGLLMTATGGLSRCSAT